jgi:hypothetical protein
VFISDSNNHRVLEYDSPLTTDKVADRVFGQLGSFTDNIASAGAAGLNAPSGLSLDPFGNLYVADSANNRVLEFNLPITQGAVADKVFGQTDMASTAPNQGGSPGPATANEPTSVVVDFFGNLYSADSLNHRALRYDAPLPTNLYYLPLVMKN